MQDTELGIKQFRKVLGFVRDPAVYTIPCPRAFSPVIFRSNNKM